MIVVAHIWDVETNFVRTSTDIMTHIKNQKNRGNTSAQPGDSVLTASSPHDSDNEYIK